MADRYLFAGGDIGMVRTNAGTPATDTTSSHRRLSWADHAIQCASGAGFICDFTDSSGASDSATTGESVRIQTRFRTNSSNATVNSIVAALDGSDQPWLALRSAGSSGLVGLYYNSGTGGSPVWTLIGSTFTAALSTLHVADIKLTLGSPHSVELYVDNVLGASGTFTQASLTSVHAFLCQAPYSSFYFSEMQAAVGYELIGGGVYYGKPAGAGANSGWTGASTAIDDVGIDDTDLISSASTGQRSTFAYGNLPSLGAGQVPGDLFMWTRGKNDGAAPANIKPVHRPSGGPDNVGSAFSGIGTTFGEFLTRYAGISASAYDAAEFGVESAT